MSSLTTYPYPRLDPRPRRVIVDDCVDLPHVPVGEAYTTSCRSQETVRLFEYRVRAFSLVQLLVGTLGVEIKECGTIVGLRVYQSSREMIVTPAMDIAIVLRNDTDRPLPVRQARFEEER